MNNIIEYEKLNENLKKNDFIFIHINKTGGTSVSEVLNINKIHFTAREIIEVVGIEKWDKLFKFTIVRNPWDKVVSHYMHRVKMNYTNMGDGHISFKEWVRCCYGSDKDINYYDQPRMFQPQLEWLKNFYEEIDLDYIIRFEKLESDFESVIKKLGKGEHMQLPHVNITNRSPYKSYYDKESLDIVKNWFYEDIDYFHYSF